jgi:NAD(P)-dependent dehydrogenase (short-subunit alcohol dehydrogenase family)
MIDLGLEGTRAIVVGAGFIPHRAGHGRGSALRLAAAGATVACVDMDEGRASEIVAEIGQAGRKAFAVVGDVRTETEAKRIIDEAAAGLGGVDVLVDVVGEAIFAPSDQQTEQDWDYQMTKNLKQFFFVMKAVLPHMVEQGTGGAITAITSVDGLGSSRFHVAYGAAKAGVISLVKTYSDEFGRYGIRVNCVAPGNVGGGVWDKPDVPFGQDAVNSLAPPRPMDIANSVLFLSSTLAARVTGQTLVVDGGATTRSPWGHTEEGLAAFKADWREERNQISDS